MPWFAKIETGIVEKSVFDQYVRAHVAYVKELAAKGHHARSGYWKRRGGGMLLFEAESMEAAEAIVAADPLIANNCVTYELYEWCVVAGEN
ncbi:YciI family protein [Lyngbya sp. CCY1209]|uniref:YciI family protein n=1 Tax=Lyngbya sp. CCY1209 TaxID=2886103 RepID=UPI002D20074C|nr:YciI family protein [Lyngbya sp. CCY1209]MEB3887054.1 YciI family protein [Lyngbya sp. CCY1209]